MILTIIIECPKCYEIAEAEYEINSLVISMDEIINAEVLCQECNKKIKMVEALTSLLMNGESST